MARALTQYGLSLKAAHAALNRLAAGEAVGVELRGDDPGAAVAALSRLGVTARLLVPPQADAKRIREAQQFSQNEFAIRYGLDIDTLQNWEQGRNTPDTPAMVLLKVIEKHPEAVVDALSDGKRKAR